MYRSLSLCAAGVLIVAGLSVASPAQAAFRVIKWPVTSFCQIWNFSLPDRPIPPNYRIISPPLHSFGTALRVKEHLIHRRVCLF